MRFRVNGDQGVVWQLEFGEFGPYLNQSGLRSKASVEKHPSLISRSSALKVQFIERHKCGCFSGLPLHASP